jgi:hypothetical protein
MRRALTLLVFTLALTATAFAKDKDKEKYQRPGPIHLTPAGEKWAEKTLRKLTLEEKVGQVFMIWCRASFLNVENPEYLQLARFDAEVSRGLVRDDRACGWSVSSAQRTLRSCRVAQSTARASRSCRLLFAADFERGVPMRLMGATDLSARHGFRRRWQDQKMQKLSDASPLRNRVPSAFTGIFFLMPT